MNDIIVQEAEFDGQGRRIRKTVTNSGDLDATTVYYWNRSQIVETRDGSGNLETQVYHGTQYIDEVVSQRLPEGRVYTHQDANYNVTGLTDLTGRQLERYYYSPYGQLEATRDAHPFDYDDDGDVDEADIAAATSGGDCWGDYTGDCRRLDANSDQEIDATDHTAISNYVATLSTNTQMQRIPIAQNSQLGNTFGHQGLVLDSELASYQNRHRQYAPKARRFMQRDPLLRRAKCSSGYQDGLSTYLSRGGRPLSTTDASGLLLGGLVGYDCCRKAVLEEMGDDFDAGNGRPGGGSGSGGSGTVAWSYLHCVTHCVIVKSPKCGSSRAARLAKSIAAGVGAEAEQLANCGNAGHAQREEECQSAFQWSDKCDNQAGRDAANSGESCSNACATALGGKIRGQLPEGPGTIRPYGPYHPSAHGPVWSNPCPAEWPAIGVDDVPAREVDPLPLP